MRVINLFAGCGGFALGAQQAGCQVVVAIDIDRVLTSTYQRNFQMANLIIDDIRNVDAEAVRLAARGPIDGVFGGPPCQPFSDIGKRSPHDPRRNLLFEFFRIVAETQPRFYVMENVRGLGYVDAVGVLEAGLKLLSERYNSLGPIIFDAATFGAPTRRARLFVIGIHKDEGDGLTDEDMETFSEQPTTVREAIFDLRDATYVEEDSGFDVWKILNTKEYSTYARKQHSKDLRITGHRKPKHSKEVSDRFMSVKQGGCDLIGRHARLSWSGQCPIIRAGTGSDRGSYLAVRPIHPEEPRVITVREAARLQGFPDNHLFHPTVWHSFRMIGNSVSPIMSKVIFAAILQKLGIVTSAIRAAG